MQYTSTMEGGNPLVDQLNSKYQANPTPLGGGMGGGMQLSDTKRQQLLNLAMAAKATGLDSDTFNKLVFNVLLDPESDKPAVDPNEDRISSLQNMATNAFNLGDTALSHKYLMAADQLASQSSSFGLNTPTDPTDQTQVSRTALEDKIRTNKMGEQETALTANPQNPKASALYNYYANPEVDVNKYAYYNPDTKGIDPYSNKISGQVATGLVSRGDPLKEIVSFLMGSNPYAGNVPNDLSPEQINAIKSQGQQSPFYQKPFQSYYY